MKETTWAPPEPKEGNKMKNGYLMVLVTIVLIVAAVLLMNGINVAAGWTLLVIGSMCALITMGSLNGKRPS